jgi:hypothetical protein
VYLFSLGITAAIAYAVIQRNHATFEFHHFLISDFKTYTPFAAVAFISAARLFPSVSTVLWVCIMELENSRDVVAERPTATCSIVWN